MSYLVVTLVNIHLFSSRKFGNISTKISNINTIEQSRKNFTNITHFIIQNKLLNRESTLRAGLLCPGSRGLPRSTADRVRLGGS